MAILSVEAFKTNVTLTGTAENDYLDALVGGGNNTLNGGDGDDELFAYSSDQLYGEAGNDKLHSQGNGNNTLSGGEGNDYIYADRNDIVFGDAGDDIIFGGLGGNTITGGLGKDTFHLANAEYPNNPNIITDFNPTEDLLQVNVDEFNEINKLTFTTQGNDTLISAGSKQLAILKNYELPQFSIASASAIEGNAINFTITRTGNSQANQSVTVSTSINSDDTASENDLTAKNETLTFTQGETSKTFTVQTTQDSLIEKDETFTVALTNSTNGSIINNKGIIKNDDIPIANLKNNDIFTIKGEGNQVRLKVNLVELNSTFINELGVFKVDDTQGKINGISPGAANYNEEVLKRAKVVFSAISNLPNGVKTGDFTRSLEFDSGDNLKFFLIKDGTIDSAKAGKISLSNLLFADASTQKIIDFGTEGFSLSWEDGSGNVTDFKDIVVKIQSTKEALVIGTGLQGGNQGELIDLRDIQGQVKANVSVHREAAFNNEVYFYEVDNADGQIGNLQPSSVNRSNYLQAALNNIIKDVQSGVNIKFATANQGVQTSTTTINGGTILAPMIIVNGTLSQLLDSDANNNPQVYFSYMGVNSDGVDHIRLLGNNTFGFEDLPNGGDLDYNDMIVKMNFTEIIA
ncbi:MULTISPECIES: DUF4114 domain-containing protein [unclassified Anabaena]|uniref:DUF4114 domain-containing protein n=1 Tax=unclassified Anabaena TaxID=2619674 RepID=UPI0014488954|nr:MULTISPECIES: DUF4114 domain-containing protein [unclassified Anabaena]MTJ06563.1 DUF4114 domain-containing protein [Anabaena sp. UHCC 0204]MTJ54332.1 DUF4114 domain-containing protein [Anabaena sp. UHCC 0253]